MENLYYTYVFLDPRKPGKFTSPFCSFLYQPLYVGKGTNGRADTINRKQKISKPYSNDLLHKSVSNIKSLGFEIPIIKFYQNSEELAFSLERLLTEHFGIFPEGGILKNLKHGGEGGWSLSNETKQKLSELNKGNNNPGFGIKWTEERREKWFTSWKSKDRTRQPETMENTWAHIRRKYKIEDSSNNIFIVDDLTKFCKEHKLPLTSLRSALLKDGIVKSSGSIKNRKSRVEGWKIEYITS